MKQKAMGLVTIIGVVGVLAAVGLVFWAIVRGIDREPSVVGSLFTAAAAVAAVVWGQHWSQRLALRQRHRDQMTPVYSELLDRTRGEGAGEDEQFWKDMQRHLLLNGPPEVLQAVLHWKATFNENAADDDPTNLLNWELVLLAIRKDLGHDDKNLKRGDLLRVYVNDIDILLARYDMGSSS